MADFGYVDPGVALAERLGDVVIDGEGDAKGAELEGTGPGVDVEAGSALAGAVCDWPAGPLQAAIAAAVISDRNVLRVVMAGLGQVRLRSP